jgi:hypothetical protein
VIGPNWLNVRDEQGNRRLDNPSDFLRIEIATALQRGIPVIPILLDGAKMPRIDQLPQDLEELSVRNGIDIRHASFPVDMDKLIRGLKGTRDARSAYPSARAGSPSITSRTPTAVASSSASGFPAWTKDHTAGCLTFLWFLLHRAVEWVILV